MTTTPTASPELPDLDKLEALARAATPGPWAYQEDSDVYTHIVRPVQSPGRIVHHYSQDTSGVVEANARFTAGANPAAVLALIALARRAQPEGEAPQAVAYLDLDKLSVGGMAYATSFRTNDKQTALVKAAATLSPLCGAQHAESGEPHGLTIGEAFKAVGGWMNGGELGYPSFGSMNALLAYTQKMVRAALAAQQAAAPGARIEELESALEAAMNRETVLEDRIHELEHMLDGSLINEGTSAPGTPEAPSQLMQALTTGIPLQEPVYIAKALRAQREVRVSLAGGTGPGAAAFLANIQMTPWTYTKETAEAYAWGYNRALKDYRAALLDVAAQLDGGQEGSAS